MENSCIKYMEMNWYFQDEQPVVDGKVFWRHYDINDLTSRLQKGGGWGVGGDPEVVTHGKNDKTEKN